MLRSTRAALAVGLGFVGVAGLVGQSIAQQQDGKVTKVAAANTGTGASAPAPLPAVSIGSIDIEAVFRAYDKVKVAGETLNAEVKVRYDELTKLANEGKQEQQKLEHFVAGSADARRCEERMVQVKAAMEAARQNAEREFTQKETETMTAIYNEVVEMAKGVAQQRGMTFIVKYNEGKIQSSEPNSAMASMSKTIIYADPRVDITADTIKYLHHYYYKVANGKPPKNPNSNAGAGTGTGTNAPATRPASAAPAGR